MNAAAIRRRMAPPQATPASLPPAHEHLFQSTMDALEALLALDAADAIVASMRIGQQTPVITLTRAPRSGTLQGVYECRGAGGAVLMRGLFRGRGDVICEWTPTGGNQ